MVPAHIRYKKTQNKQKEGAKTIFLVSNFQNGEFFGECISKRGNSPTENPKGEVPPLLGECDMFDNKLNKLKIGLKHKNPIN